jgi:hypothetical protein
MPAPSHGWKPQLTPIPGPSRGWKTMTTGPKLPDGQAAALVAATDMHPERRSRHPPSANPRQSTTISGSSSRWKPKAMDPKLPDGEAAAPDADAGLPPNGHCRSHPASRDGQTRGGKVPEVGPPMSILGQDTLERGVMSGELPLTYLPLDSFLSLSLFIILYPPLLHTYW